MRYCILLVYYLVLSLPTMGQTVAGGVPLPDHIEVRYLQEVAGKLEKLDARLTASTRTSLRNLQRAERKIYKKLLRVDSVAAKRFLETSDRTYATLHARMAQINAPKKLREYIPAFDTLKTTVGFIGSLMNQQKNSLAGRQLEYLETRIQNANDIKRLLLKRKEVLEKELAAFRLPKLVARFNKETAYYQQGLAQFKALMSDRRKFEKKLMRLLKESQPFKEFMARHGMLALLAGTPDGGITTENTGGLQTISSVQAMLSARLAPAGISPETFRQGQLLQAQASLEKIKSQVKQKLDKLSENGEPNSSLNPEKTKPFLQRLEYGLNVQTQRSNNWMPVTTEWALSLGYRINPNSSIGLGAAHRFGWGENPAKLRFTHEGLGLRSYADLRIRGNLWITAAYEENYFRTLQMSALQNDTARWKNSAMLGLTKKLSLGKNKESRVQVLYDFLAKQNNHLTQPLIFRIGYTLK